MSSKYITIERKTATTISASMCDGEGDYFVGTDLTLYNADKSAVVATATIKGNPNPQSVEETPVATFTGLTPNTNYYAYYSSATGYVAGKTNGDEPRVALESQWGEMAEKIKSLEARIAALEGN